VGYVERDAYAAAVLLARMEDSYLEPAPVWCGNLEGLDTAPFRGVDILTAGFPCQPWSVAGKRAGTDDARWIWPAIASIIGDVGPRIVFLENVPGLLAGGVAEVLGSLAALGYDAEWDLFRASDVGAPHRRERWFCLAYARCGGVDSGQPEYELGCGHPTDVGEVGAEVADAGSVVRQHWESQRECSKEPRLWVHTWGDGSAVVADSEDDHGRAGVVGTETGVGEVMADAYRGRELQPGGGKPDERGWAGDQCKEVADGEFMRLERRGVSVGERADERTAWPPGPQDMVHSLGTKGMAGFQWPPGPEDREGWEDYLRSGGPEPCLRGSAARVPHRMDRLRCLGNAVVPAQAERAFRILWERMSG
jgi:DNA (cytosine-5)-methyltransferase 1